MDMLCRLRDLEPLLHLLLPCAQVLEPILSFVDVVCTALEPDPSVGNTACTGYVWLQLSRMFSRLGGVFLHVPFTSFGCPCL